ncbi:NACHT domain-containing protein [Bradyrhizobium ottawaense]|uniref:NACHT domain-containing protein n=1 Tax=Bradyrhizobium ottawaense TaxID=931866 RepID=UPI003518F453
MTRATNSPPTYAWPRFWIRLGGPLDLSDAGFLSDPTDSHDPDRPVTLADLQGRRSLALLGEPGIGKSTALKEEADRVATLAVDGHLQSIYVDLRSFSSEEFLFKRVFENEKMTRWKGDESHLFLHLDSLDEALLRIDSIANLIADELPNLPTERLSLRIACRTALWPAATLGRALADAFGQGAGVFELAPLRRTDILAALDAHGIRREEFMRALFAAHARPFAIKPLTLKMLLAVYEEDGALPESSVELYRRGCLALCEESNKSRRDTNRRGRLNAGQRMRLAGRMAAATIVGNRFAIWTGLDAECPDEDITVPSLAGSEEKGDFAPFAVTDDDVREALDTGLFAAHGEQRMGWAHRGYGEFLGALYLHLRGVPAMTILKAVRHPTGGLIPQLAGMAAWAASLDDEVRAALIAEDPIALLGGDLSGLRDQDKTAILKSLLDAVENKRVTDSVYSHSEIYAKLKHAGLATELRPFVVDAKLSPTTRRLALLVAEKCEFAELQPDLLRVVLDETNHPQVRNGAISALRTCGDASVPPQILPFAEGKAKAQDPNDEIKGAALELLWPDHLTVDRLFQLLTPSVDLFFGSYAHFLATLPETLKDEHLLAALRWSTNEVVGKGRSGNGHGRRLADAIMFRVWPIFERVDLTEPFVDDIAARLRNHGPLFLGLDLKGQKAFRENLQSDHMRRRTFLSALCRRAIAPVEAYNFHRAEFVIAADLEWLLSLVPEDDDGTGDVETETLFGLIERVFDLGKVDHVEALAAAIERSSLVRARYGLWFEPVRLDSQTAENGRQREAQWRALDENLPPPIEPDPPKKVRALLAEAEGGDWRAWCHLTNVLALTSESRGYGDELDYFITTTPGWNEADADIRARIVAGAERYLLAADASVDGWLGHRPMTIPYGAIAGLRAIVLLRQVSPDSFDRITEETWKKWTPVIVGLPRLGTEASPVVGAILLDAMRHASHEFISAIRTIIRLERVDARKPSTNQMGSPYHILSDLEGCWQNDMLLDAIFEELRDPDNTPAEYASFLDALLCAGFQPALDHALGLLATCDASKHDRDYAITEVLVRREPVRSWTAISTTMNSDDDLARRIVTRVAMHFDFGSPFYRDLDENDIAGLFRLVTRLFPPRQDVKRATGFVGALDSIADLRDGLPRHLAGMGTTAAVTALNELIADHPQLTHLSYELAIAQRAMRLTTWSPMDPKEVLALADKPSLKLVNTAADLCDVLSEALAKFAGSLHGAQTPVRDLWDRQGSQSVFRPIDENGFSDVVVRFLQSELVHSGIFANREVEVSRVPGAPVGKRTDILINAVRRRSNGDASDIVTAVIETKGCWNTELFTALEAQLFREYMVRLRAQAGVFLVGWFETDNWDPADGRRRAVPKISIGDVRARLEGQAAGLPNGIVIRPIVIECRTPS